MTTNETTNETTDKTTNENANTPVILVLGASGKTGRRVADRLETAGAAVRRGSRSASPPFDWEDPATWPAALEGVASVYVSFYPDLAVPGAPEAVAAFTAEARRAGVRRVVLLSGRGEAEAQRAEEVIAAAGMEWTVVRASWFAQNFSEGAFLDAVNSGEVVLPVGDVREPFIDVEDIADVAVAALTEDGHHEQVYEVTGPQLLTFAEAVRAIAEASGREVAFTSVPLDAFTAYLAEAGEAPEVIEMLAYLFAEVLDGRNAYVTDGVKRAIGRPPRDFADYARTAAAKGVWK
ncbi:NmrA family protein [Catenulispora acidiphila DSM 44928]|uniref:NmrA family protein n=1 Tax=Catenulispora acidiphila (strain DSM 44928 / JCM 14897 / NBRC 102108 / NRRL B-24433 / ID139908) TaxID=479433 RepID=C7PWW8_CATAD|nr:NAD(P)H-binding protein [Catenulispora acidiphila]ACU77225.1 NmrA family protein [Catenulispora acidiphila DSM 44928]